MGGRLQTSLQKISSPPPRERAPTTRNCVPLLVRGGALWPPHRGGRYKQPASRPNIPHSLSRPSRTIGVLGCVPLLVRGGALWPPHRGGRYKQPASRPNIRCLARPAQWWRGSARSGRSLPWMAAPTSVRSRGGDVPLWGADQVHSLRGG